MNIKGLLGSNFFSSAKSVEKTERTIKSDITHDRDGNGRQDPHQQRDSHPQREMTPEEIEKSLSQLKNLGVVKEHKWTIDLLLEADKKFILIKDNLGTVIRKIPETELWTLNLSEDAQPKGQLLKKTA